MKIRNGFVSNSSSSSFIVEVPKDFMITADMIKEQVITELWDREILHDEGIFDQKDIDYLNSQLDILKSGQELYAGYRGCNAFWAIQSILKDQDMIVMTMDGAGGDGEDTIVPFKDNRKKKK